MIHVQALRSHLYNGYLEDGQHRNVQLQLLERIKLVDMLNEFAVHYRNLLKLASTPLPHAVSADIFCSICCGMLCWRGVSI